MLHQQFEAELVHLEGIVARLTDDRPFSLDYWRRRAAVLEPHQNVIPAGMVRMRRLLGMLEQASMQLVVDPCAHQTAALRSAKLPFR